MTSVLLIRLSAMGDLVHGLGAVAALHAARPDWSFTFVTQVENAPLLVGLPGVDDVVTFDRSGGLRGLWRLRRAMRAAGPFDIAIDLQGNWKSALVARLSGARDRIGAAAEARQEPASRVLLRRAITVPGPPHPARTALALVREVLASGPAGPAGDVAAPRLVATVAEIDAERAALAAAGVDARRPFEVIVLTDPADPRALRPVHVAARVEQMQALGMPVVLLLGPSEATLPGSAWSPLQLDRRAGSPGPQPNAPAPVAVVRHARGAVRRLVALGALVAAAGGRVIGPDQGASHVLAATGAAVDVVYGPQDPARTAPVTARVLVHPEPPECRPCRSRRCAHPDGPVCMAFGFESGRAVAGHPLAVPARD